jgi:4-hydroxy-3-polyprenylbenzoate decarboxylase
VDDLDHSARGPAFGSKMGLDGTKKWVEEGFTRPWPEIIEMDADVKAKIDAIWPRLQL